MPISFPSCSGGGDAGLAARVLGDIGSPGYSCRVNRMPLLLFQIEMRTMCDEERQQQQQQQQQKMKASAEGQGSRASGSLTPSTSSSSSSASGVAGALIVVAIVVAAVVFLVIVFFVVKMVKRKWNKDLLYDYYPVSFVNQIYGKPMTTRCGLDRTRIET